MINVDVGCGVKKKKDYLGIDLVRTKCVDIIGIFEYLPLKDSSVDILFSRRTLPHVYNFSKSLLEAKRVLKRDGKFDLVISSFIGFLYFHLFWRFINYRTNQYAYFRLFFKWNMKKVLHLHGFNVQSVKKEWNEKKFSYDLSFLILKEIKVPYQALNYNIKKELN